MAGLEVDLEGGRRESREHRRTTSEKSRRMSYSRSRSRSRSRDRYRTRRSRSRSPDYSRRRHSRSRSPYDRRRYYTDRRGGYFPERRRAPRREVYRGTEEEILASKILFVANIPYNSDERTFEEKFGQFGKIVSVSMPRDKRNGHNKGFVFVEFEDRKDAEAVFEAFNGKDFDGRNLRLDWDVGRSNKPSYNRSEGREERDRENDRHDPERRRTRPRE